MLLYTVILFGSVIIFQLEGIRRRLENSHSAVNELKEKLHDIDERITEELQWSKEYTFAHDLREWIEEIPKEIVEELQWHKSSTFAHELLERLERISKDITGELQTAATDILNTLSTIEQNTSED